MLKVLSIGNSFSQDAQKWLHQLAAENGVELQAVNLYIGGCTLKRHWENVLGDLADYDLEYNGVVGPECRKISIAGALELDQWDIITLQQASGSSGRPQRYLPWLPKLAALVREKQPQARLYIHQTWAYEWNFEAERYQVYNSDQEEMYRRLTDCYEMASELIGAELIPTGKVIQTLRRTVPAFDARNGGLSLCRDGFHLSLDYGRFAAAATWLRVLTGIQPEAKPFRDFDPALTNAILAVVAAVTEEPAEA